MEAPVGGAARQGQELALAVRLADVAVREQRHGRQQMHQHAHLSQRSALCQISVSWGSGPTRKSAPSGGGGWEGGETGLIGTSAIHVQFLPIAFTHKALMLPPKLSSHTQSGAVRNSRERLEVGQCFCLVSVSRWVRPSEQRSSRELTTWSYEPK
jgi:hypothetical protein